MTLQDDVDALRLEVLKLRSLARMAGWAVDPPRQGKVDESARKSSFAIGDRVIIPDEHGEKGRGMHGDILYVTHPRDPAQKTTYLIRMDDGGFFSYPAQDLVVEFGRPLRADDQIYVLSRARISAIKPSGACEVVLDDFAKTTAVFFEHDVIHADDVDEILRRRGERRW
jgi:hypothetical protein